MLHSRFLVEERNGTWRHGISLSTLYGRSNLSPGLSLLVVGDHKEAVFGGLGSNDTFVFTNTPGCPVIFRPTGTAVFFNTDFP
ncbi:hypothetical protein Hanom_Chr07g00664421 [Helianthus anomalus]